MKVAAYPLGQRFLGSGLVSGKLSLFNFGLFLKFFEQIYENKRIKSKRMEEKKRYI